MADGEAWEDTKNGIRLDELRERHVELRNDVRKAEVTIDSLSNQVTRVDERVRFLTRFFWLMLTGLGGLVVDAILRRVR
jgi:hypothetical protein